MSGSVIRAGHLEAAHGEPLPHQILVIQSRMADGSGNQAITGYGAKIVTTHRRKVYPRAAFSVYSTLNLPQLPAMLDPTWREETATCAEDCVDMPASVFQDEPVSRLETASTTRPLKIVLLSVRFSEKTGYVENCFPKALAALDHEVHVITSTAQVSYDDPHYDKLYAHYLGPRFVEPGVKQVHGFTLHRLPHAAFKGKTYLRHLGDTLAAVKPDVVQTFDAFSFLTLQAAWHKLRYGYRLFTANHIHASVFPLLQGARSLPYRLGFFVSRTVPGRLISWLSCRCYPIGVDPLEIAVRYYGVQREKVIIGPLGVDTDAFKPFDIEETGRRKALRQELGFKDEDIVCIYTGRFTEGKNPLLLARATEQLVEQGEPFRALFLGNGPLDEEIRKRKGCVVRPFVPHHALPTYYGIADIGVWPMQESTSMLDAAACGLPLIISDQVQTKERIEGNGLSYVEGDAEDLARVILRMKDPAMRARLSRVGVERIRDRFSWHLMASRRVDDYRKFTEPRGG